MWDRDQGVHDLLPCLALLLWSWKISISLLRRYKVIYFHQVSYQTLQSIGRLVLHLHVISSLDYSDAHLTSTRNSRSGLTVPGGVIIHSDKAHSPRGVAESAQILKALQVTTVMLPSLRETCLHSGHGAHSTLKTHGEKKQHAESPRFHKSKSEHGRVSELLPKSKNVVETFTWRAGESPTAFPLNSLACSVRTKNILQWHVKWNTVRSSQIKAFMVIWNSVNISRRGLTF